MARLGRPVAETAGQGWRELVTAEPDPRLRADVRRYAGYLEHQFLPQLWRELPHGGIVLVVSFGAPFRISTGDGPREAYPSFIAGLHDRWAMVASAGNAACLQVDLTPLGALRLLGRPMEELSNLVLPLEALLGLTGRQLAEQLAGMAGWQDRFELVERLLLHRLGEARSPNPAVAWAWRQLQISGGTVAIGSLADEIGWSRKHLVTRFRREIGLPPKTVARILRFDGLVRRLERADQPRWAEVAVEAGYYDQAHLIREFHELAGVTPGEWWRSHVTDAGITDR